MDEFMQTLVLGAPNIIVALVVLYWQNKRLDRLEQHILDQNDRLTGKGVIDEDVPHAAAGDGSGGDLM